MATIPEEFAIAIGHHQRGRLQAAEQICRRIVELDPRHAEALHLLGVIGAQTGKHQLAIEYFNCALAIEPNWAVAQASLGNAFANYGKLDDAVGCYLRALQLKPDLAEAHSNLGKALKEQGKPDEALACYRRALQVKPDFAEAHGNLGNVLWEQGRWDEAVPHLQRAVQLKPDFAEAHNSLGNALRQQGRLDEAVSHLQRALQIKPDFAVAHNNLGNAYRDLGRRSAAVASYSRALEQQPKYAGAHSNLGTVLGELGRLDEAVACFRRALELAPDFAEAHSNLGNALKNQRKLDEAIDCYRRALVLKPDCADAHNSLLHSLHYCPGVTPVGLAQAHANYGQLFAAPRSAPVPRRESTPDRHGRLRVGFVSPDLGAHPVGYFLVRALENLNHDEFETICYSDRIFEDDLTHRLQAAATHWRKVYGMSHQLLAEQIRAERIDILFDLAGHTAHNRLAVFAVKPAPVQVTWAGYVGTTGLASMDYILADRFHIPPQSDADYCEKVLRMPDGYVCYDPPREALPVSPLPAPNKGYVTFGSFNNPAKLNRHVIEVWAKILRLLPQSRLLLKYKGMCDTSLAQGLTDEFAARGIDPGRLTLQDCSSRAELLAEYHFVDLALDPFPYSGGVTTCEALWMGVPVVTCPGETFASRHSLSHLSNVGLTETIAKDFDDYVDLAVSLAGDLPRLGALRSGLRERMAASPLCDGRRFATNFAAMLRQIWEQAAAS